MGCREVNGFMVCLKVMAIGFADRFDWIALHWTGLDERLNGVRERD